MLHGGGEARPIRWASANASKCVYHLVKRFVRRSLVDLLEGVLAANQYQLLGSQFGHNAIADPRVQRDLAGLEAAQGIKSRPVVPNRYCRW